jgi:lipopolysaccharide export system protein LptA
VRGTLLAQNAGLGRGSCPAPGCALRLALGAALLVLAPTAADAQTGKHGSNLPIEITADRLEVVQPQRIATFTGNVDAVQGDMVLSADLLRVFYNGNGDSQDAAGAGPGGGSIRRIEAEGNVFLSSPTQTAQGERGIYDVASDQMTLNGSVVLTQGDDVIRGDRLEVDLASGHSRVLAAAPTSADGAKPQRVRALFVPRNAPAAGPAGTGADAEPAPADSGRTVPPPAKPAPTK